MCGTKERLFILFETWSSGRGAARVGAESRGNRTLRAEVQTRQPLAVKLWIFLEILAERKIEAGIFRRMRNWRRHVQDQRPTTYT